MSSPTVAMIDGVQAVVFGSESGYVFVVNAATGQNLPGWPQPVELAAGAPSAVESSPTVAYLDGAGKPPSIVVGAGSTYVKDQQGGLVAFNANGTVRFVFHTQDIYNEWNGQSTPGPTGYDDAVFSTPAVGDITGTGQQDIVFGSWDHELYALTPTGALVPGFPFQTQDTIWSSPALFHVRGGRATEDIFIGGDATGRNGCYGGFVYDFTYRHQQPKIVWQHCERQTIWSSPAVGMINSSGRPAVVVGTGFGELPPYTSASDKVFAFYADNGARVAGWPVTTAGPVFGSPAIGVLPGSTTPAVVDTSWCTTCTTSAIAGTSEVYAWSGTGKMLWNQTVSGPNDFASPVLVDLTGSGANDVLVGAAGGLYALDGANGAFMFGESAADPINTCSVQTSVAVADLGAGSGWHMFEACGGPWEVTGTGRLYDYPLPASPATAPPWPMWRQNPGHAGVATLTLPSLVASSASHRASAPPTKTRRGSSKSNGRSRGR
ncbi:MAG: repeat-containing protein [Acidimicrobiaceae bacterium]|nr:repeat-containing protein [Acidimicrobiaceae bacterium]